MKPDPLGDIVKLLWGLTYLIGTIDAIVVVGPLVPVEFGKAPEFVTSRTAAAAFADEDHGDVQGS